MAKVSIIITARNYGRYLSQCIDSALRQQYPSFEVIVADDGSTDDTPAVLERYAGRVRALRLEGVGLARACNAAIAVSSGDYVVRFDADDFFDENLVLVEANVLDLNPNVHLVYPDYYRVNADGQILELARQPRIYDQVKVLDRNPLAIGAMYRRECYDAIGGYDEELRQQEDYDFWLRFTSRFTAHNVNLPLMYYRQHDVSMSTNAAGRLDARRRVKTKFIESRGGLPSSRVLGVVPAMARLIEGVKLPLADVGGRPLLSYVISALRATPAVDRIVVSTEDAEVADAARLLGASVPYLRPPHLARSGASVEAVVQHLLQRLAVDEDYRPDLVAVAHVHSPMLQAKHIVEALQSMAIYETDSVLSVTPDLSFHWRPGEFGLEPVGYQKRLLREEKDMIFKENGALYLVRAECARAQDFIGRRVGHVEMLASESLRIATPHDLFMARQMLASVPA